MCPSCRALVHADALNRHAEAAERAEAMGDANAALIAWREASALLPRGSVQQREVEARIASLSRLVDGIVPPPSTHEPAKKRAGLAAGALTVGLLLFKFKAVIFFALTKAKFLLLGLTKAQTFFSMFVMFAVYWSIYRWPFALGFVVSLYIHEMGHVFALSRYGVKASAPMFVPGLGAFIRVQQHFSDVREDARTGLAGPLWGLGAAIVSLLLYFATGIPVLAAIARVGAWLNLFNLLPVWQLDGGRGFRAIAKRDRWIVVAVAAAMLFVTQESWYLILAIAGGVVATTGQAPEKSDRVALLQFIGLLIALGPFFFIPIEGIR